MGAFLAPLCGRIFLEEEGKKMSRLLVIGCIGVAQVAISKVCQAEDTFKEVMIASRTKSKCDDLKVLEGKTSVQTAQSGRGQGRRSHCLD